MKKSQFISAGVLLVAAVFLLTPWPWTKARSAKFGPEYIYQTNEVDPYVRLAGYVDSCKSRRIDSLLTRVYNLGAFNGQVLYAENGKVLYSRGFGYTDIRRRRDSVNTQTRFQLASLSKPFTAVAVMQLYMKGLVDIYAPVSQYIPDFPYAKDSVTVKQLLQHRSGIGEYTHASFWPAGQIMHNNDLSAVMARHNPRLEFRPDGKFRYRNTNYAYLARIVEVVSEMSFAEYFDKYIAQPLHMNHTFVFDPQNPKTENTATGFSFRKPRGKPGYFYARQPDYLDGVTGDKGIYSTCEDLLQFDQALYDNKFLPDSILQLMFTPSEPLKPGGESVYGMGFRVHLDAEGNHIPFHNGWWKGFRSYFTHDCVHNRTLIWLCNRSDVTVQPYIDEIFRISDSYGRHNSTLVSREKPEKQKEENENYGSR